MSALEALRWHENTARSPSDETILAQRRKLEMVERRPSPLNLSDTEILNWLAEYCDQSVYTRPTPEYRGGFTLYCDDIKTSGQTLREAVCLAAARHKEANS